MIKQRSIYDICCDVCGEEMDTDNGDYRQVFFGEQEAAEQAESIDWYTKGGKHICSECPHPGDDEGTKEDASVKPVVDLMAALKDALEKRKGAGT